MLGIKTWTYLGGHFSAFHSIPSGPQRFTPIPHTTRNQPHPKFPKGLSSLLVQTLTQVSLALNPQISSKSPKTGIGESLHVTHPAAKFLPFCQLVKWENKLYIPKLWWPMHRITVTTLPFKNGEDKWRKWVFSPNQCSNATRQKLHYIFGRRDDFLWFLAHRSTLEVISFLGE